MYLRSQNKYYQEILDDPSNEKLATIVINLLEYMQGSTQAYLTNQATCLALVDVLQKKHIFSLLENGNVEKSKRTNALLVRGLSYCEVVPGRKKRKVFSLESENRILLFFQNHFKHEV